jgi:hypothetical protein
MNFRPPVAIVSNVVPSFFDGKHTCVSCQHTFPLFPWNLPLPGNHRPHKKSSLSAETVETVSFLSAHSSFPSGQLPVAQAVSSPPDATCPDALSVTPSRTTDSNRFSEIPLRQPFLKRHTKFENCNSVMIRCDTGSDKSSVITHEIVCSLFLNNVQSFCDNREKGQRERFL